jgi:transcriptional regulator with XRE-family HTH domain
MIDRDQFYIEMGERLRAKREAFGLTQAEVAEAIGISRTSLTNIECGRQRILVDQLALICGKLRASPSDMIPAGAPAPQMSHARLAEIPVVANFLQSMARGKTR